MIHLVEVDSSNWRTPLKVSRAQEEYVANKGFMKVLDL